MKALILLIALLAQVAQAAPQKTGSYYIPVLEKNGEVDLGTCEELTDGPVDGIYGEWACFLGDQATFFGYQLFLQANAHALDLSVSYYEHRVSWDDMWSEVSPSSGASHFYGLVNGKIEVRYYIDKSQREMQQVPFALIYRNETTRYDVDPDGNAVHTTDEELIIIHLDKENTRAVAKVNARQKGANAKARQIADQLLNK